MIITLKKANFSKNNIGILDSFSVLTSLGNGCTYSGPTNVARGAALNATISINSSYALSSISVSMQGTNLPDCYTVENNKITLNIANVTGSIAIEVATVATNVQYTITYKYMSGGVEFQPSTTETVSGGAIKTFSIESAPVFDGYNCVSVSPTSATVNKNLTVSYVYEAIAIEGENLLTLGELYEQKVLSSSAPTLSTRAETYTYMNVPVEAGKTYSALDAKRCWWLDADKNKISTYNGKDLSPQWQATAPENAAYWCGSIYYAERAVADATMVEVK